MTEKLYSMSSAGFLLGSFLNNPKLALSDKYKINLKSKKKNDNINDFVDLFHKQLYGVIRNLAQRGVEDIDNILISEFIENYPTVKTNFENLDYMEKITTMKNICKIEAIDYHYFIVRKYSLLRYYREQGYDISKFYDEDGIEENEREKLGQFEIQDIVEYFEVISNKARNVFLQDEDTEYTVAGENFAETKAFFQREKFYGFSTLSNYLNAVTRGLIKGQLCMYSSPSGFGKTTIALSTLVNICCPQLFDVKLNKYVDNPCYTCNGGLYIQYEMSNELEVTTKMISNISKIPTNVIFDGDYTDEQSARIDKANEILLQSNVHIICCPNFNTRFIKEQIQDYKVKHGIEFVVFDYISVTPGLNREQVDKNGGITPREDEVLLALATELKSMARQLNVCIYTMTQTSDNIKTAQVKDNSVLSGAKSLVNRVDIGAVLTTLTNEEEESAEAYVNEGFSKPNYIYHMYKVRFGSTPPNTKIWVHVNLGTGEITDCFVTNKYNLLFKEKITPCKLEREVM